MKPCKLQVQSCKLQTRGDRLQRRYQNTLFSHLALDSCLQAVGCRRSLQSGYYKAVGSQGLALGSDLQAVGCRRSLQSGYYKTVGSQVSPLTLARRL